MKKIIPLLLVAIPLVVVNSCTHEPILPDQQVSFSSDILPIVQSSCQHSGCHDSLGSGEFPLIDYTSVMERCEVKAGKPNKSKLYQVITASQNSEEFMPRSPYPALTDRNIKLIYIWIAQGAKDN